jgi:hypothetical protein
MEQAAMEYGGHYTRSGPESVTMQPGPDGLKMVNSGIRFNVDTYRDFYC